MEKEKIYFMVAYDTVEEVLILRGYQTLEAAYEDTCDANDLVINNCGIYLDVAYFKDEFPKGYIIEIYDVIEKYLTWCDYDLKMIHYEIAKMVID